MNNKTRPSSSSSPPLNPGWSLGCRLVVISFQNIAKNRWFLPGPLKLLVRGCFVHFVHYGVLLGRVRLWLAHSASEKAWSNLCQRWLATGSSVLGCWEPVVWKNAVSPYQWLRNPANSGLLDFTLSVTVNDSGIIYKTVFSEYKYIPIRLCAI